MDSVIHFHSSAALSDAPSWLMVNERMLDGLRVTPAASSLQRVLWSDSGDANRKHTLLLCVCVRALKGDQKGFLMQPTCA